MPVNEPFGIQKMAIENTNVNNVPRVNVQQCSLSVFVERENKMHLIWIGICEPSGALKSVIPSPTRLCTQHTYNLIYFKSSSLIWEENAISLKSLGITNYTRCFCVSIRNDSFFPCFVYNFMSVYCTRTRSLTSTTLSAVATVAVLIYRVAK